MLVLVLLLDSGLDLLMGTATTTMTTTMTMTT